MQAKAPPVIDRASEWSVLCGNRPLAYLPLASRLYDDASPKIPARLGPIGRVSATSSNRSQERIALFVDASGQDKNLVKAITSLSLPNIRVRQGVVPVISARGALTEKTLNGEGATSTHLQVAPSKASPILCPLSDR